MFKSKYEKPDVKVEEFTRVDILTASTNDTDDLHSTDDYNYGN